MTTGAHPATSTSNPTIISTNATICSINNWRKKLMKDMTESLGAFIDPDLLAIAKIGLSAYFENKAPTFLDRFPVAETTTLSRLISQQNDIGWDHFLRGKLSQAWGPAQYRYAKRFNLVDASKHWITKLIRLFANSTFEIWEIRNGCRHGIDTAAKQLAKQQQAHRELRCMYTFKNQVLPQDAHLFQDSVEAHLSQTTAQIQTWLVHNKKLITHSVQIAKTQTRLRIKRMQSYFPSQGRKKSHIIATGKTTRDTPRQRNTRMANHFTTKQMKRSTTKKTRMKEKLRLFNTPTMSAYYQPNRETRRPMPIIDEDQPAHTTSPQRWMTRRRHLNDKSLCPDHPG